MDDLIDLTHRLRPLHLPPEPSWWPPAPGWWLLAALGLLAAVGMAWWVHQRFRGRRVALAELQRLHRAYREARDPVALTAGVSELLKRVALTRFPRDRVAGLSGEDWRIFLNDHGGEFVEPFQPYVSSPSPREARELKKARDEKARALLAAARHWIRRQA